MIYQDVLLPKILPEYDIELFDKFKELDCFSIVNDKSDLECIENPDVQKWLQFDHFVIMGTGGASLGGQCIHAISSEEITFINNLDANTLEKTFAKLNFRKTGFLCISKSGETLETISQLLLIISRLQDTGNETRVSDHIIVITEDKNSSLKQIAVKFGCLCLEHPKTIGGRFSVFSIVGMLPAVMCGIDPLIIRTGGQNVLKNIERIKSNISFISHNLKQNITQHVSFVYSDRLLPFASWLAQLYSESTGKIGKGITPLTAVGSIDQHSQLQLYLDGNNDKCFTFFLERSKSDISIDRNSFIPENFSYLKNKKISEIFESQHNATISSLLEKNRSIRKIEISLSPEALGELFMSFMIEVTCVCQLLNVEPFDQPAVERCKIITKKILDNLK